MQHLRLSQLTFIIEQTLTSVFYGKTFLVIAEACEIKKSSNGHCYFELVEKEGRNIIAKMKAVIWKSYSQIITDFEAATGKRFENNMELLMKVEVRYHVVFGLQLNVVDIDAKYILGKLESERLEILQRLVKENPSIIALVDGEFITKNKRLQPPLVFQNIALITAANSDGQRDFKHELENNNCNYKFNITEFLTQVQGRDAEQLIIQQLNLIATSKQRFDVVVIVRGGGSQTDFSCFDTYEIGKAIAGYGVPVISGIGHERNICIADMMSYIAVKTPTKAASHIIQHNKYFEDELAGLTASLKEKVIEELESKTHQLDAVIGNFKFYVENIFDQQNHSLEKFQIAVKHLNPENILKRGFAMIIKNQKIVSDPALIEKNDSINILIKNKKITSTVTEIENSAL